MLSVQTESKRLADPMGFASLIDREVERDAVGMNSIADALGLKRNMLRQWRKLIKRPWLRTFVKMCLRLGAHPAEVAYPDSHGELTFPWSPWPDRDPPWLRAKVRPVWSARCRSSKARLRREANALDTVIAAGGCASVMAAALSVGVTYDRLKHNFPEQHLKLHKPWLRRFEPSGFAVTVKHCAGPSTVKTHLPSRLLADRLAFLRGLFTMPIRISAHV